MGNWLWRPIHLIFLTALFAFLREAIRSIKTDSDSKHLMSSAFLIQLPITDSQKSPQVFAFTKEIWLGRGSSNDLILDDPFVSLSHARIFLEGEEYWLEDLGSTNRTYVNGELVKGRRKLKQAAIIALGNAMVVFHTSPNSPVGKG
ncbi:MAG: FHA domain-containing protein [Firmicutes bacterium]|nr:FHA domain-containing protein [Bacillota bacterium]